MNSEQSIVVIEDEPDIADLLDMYLRRDGYRVFLCPDGASGLATVAQRDPALVILDVGLPDTDGFEVCRTLRASGNTCAVLMLTARDDEIDRVLGLEIGADDYVTKPFSPREMSARVKAILRRTAAPATTDTPEVIEFGDLRVDLARHEATLSNSPVPLAGREFELLAYLARHRGLALSRRQLLDGAWGDGWIGDERTVDVHVRQLRKKLGDSFQLSTVWGVGYRLD